MGIDLVSVTDVARSIATFGNRYLDRLYSVDEIAYCLDAAGPETVAERFAARFAAKEALFKVLQWGDRPTDWRSVEVRRNADGSCALVLHNEVSETAKREGYRDFAVSLSHDHGYAAAVVAAWREH